MLEELKDEVANEIPNLVSSRFDATEWMEVDHELLMDELQDIYTEYKDNVVSNPDPATTSSTPEISITFFQDLGPIEESEKTLNSIYEEFNGKLLALIDTMKDIKSNALRIVSENTEMTEALDGAIVMA